MFSTVHASGHTVAAESIVARVEEAIIFPLIALMMGVALVIFLWGAFEYVYNSDSDQGRETGRRHMLYGVIGMLVMLSAVAILRVATGTFGIDF